MKFVILFSLMTLSCIADEYWPTRQALFAFTDDNLQDRHFDFGKGYTTVHLYNFTVKITAEQRFSDKELLVIAFPQEEGISFRIQSVRIGRAPHFNLTGNVVKVFGTFIARANMGAPMHVRMMVPIQPVPVNQFTLSANEALIQGNQFMQKMVPQMLTGDTP